MQEKRKPEAKAVGDLYKQILMKTKEEEKTWGVFKANGFLHRLAIDTSSLLRLSPFIILHGRQKFDSGETRFLEFACLVAGCQCQDHERMQIYILAIFDNRTETKHHLQDSRFLFRFLLI